ncbi:MAG: ABC transporter permease [Vicinamibacterales bacterium]
MTALGGDIRVSLRRLRQQPAFALTAVLVLGLGIGACAVVLSLARVVVLRPLPYADPDRLVLLWNARQPGDTTWLSAQEVVHYGRDARTLVDVAAYAAGTASLTGGGEPERVTSALVTPGLFDTLRVPALLGRTFTPADAAAGAAGPIVIGHGLWQRRFGGDPGIVGRDLQLDGRARTVIGVMPAGFQLPLDYRAERPTELWTALAWDAANLGQWGNRSYIGVARLAPGHTAAEATSELAVIADRWVQAGVVLDNGDGSLHRSAVPAGDLVTGGVRGALALLVAAVLVMMLLAAANVAGLVMIGAEARRHDMAVRAALGAGRGRLARQVAVEHAVLAAAGGLAGLGVAAAGMRAVAVMGAASLPRAGDLALDGRAVAVLAAAAGVAGVVCGVLPVLRLSRADAGTLAETTRGSAARPRQRARQVLVVAQVAASVLLFVGATLLVRTLLSLQRVDLGLSTANVLTADLQLPASAYPAPADVVRFYRGLDDRLRDVPGVVAAGAVRVLPLSRTIGDWSIRLEGRPYVPAENPNADFQAVTPGYFAAMGLRILRGRGLTAADREDAPLVAVVNETMAGRYWPGQDAIGRQFMMGTDDKPWLTIVGIVGQVRHNAIVEEPRAEMYVAHAQLPAHVGSAPRGMALVVKTQGDPVALAPSLRAAVRALDPALPLGNVRTMDDLAATHLAHARFTATLLAVFAALAGVLALVGLYGAVSLVADERAPEIGVRLALGADRASILRLVLGEGVSLTLLGAGLGVAAAAAVAGAIDGLLYGVAPRDPLTFVAVPVLFAAVALVASLIPARRAARLDPLTTIRR